MRYELIRDGDVGVLIDPTPILRDIKDTFTVSFVLPENSAYVALFRDESGVEYRTTIRDGTAKVPKQILSKEQRVGLTVCQIDGDAITHSWECQTLKVGTFISLRKTQWQITAGVDDKELFIRIAELERVNAKARIEYSALLEAFASLQGEFTRNKQGFELSHEECIARNSELTKEVSGVRRANEMLAAEYNKAIIVINNLSERLAALESNYDPTVIK